MVPASLSMPKAGTDSTILVEPLDFVVVGACVGDFLHRDKDYRFIVVKLDTFPNISKDPPLFLVQRNALSLNALCNLPVRNSRQEDCIKC